MTTRNRSLPGANTAVDAISSTDALTFPAHLLSPPKSQMVFQSDAVADRISKLGEFAQRLGENFGISYPRFTLNARNSPSPGDSTATTLFLLESLTYQEERISLERRNGTWGLYFQRCAAVLNRDAATEVVALRDAPLDVRERFLLASEPFFRAYIELCKQRLGSMHEAVGAADRTLGLLADVRLV